MRLLAALLLVLIVGLSPLWFGSNRPLPWSAHALLVGVVLLCTGLGVFINRQHPALRLGTLAGPVVLMGVVLGWSVAQALPVGMSPHPAWSLAASSLGEELVGAISINPTETWWAITRWLTAGGVFLAAYCLARDRGLAILMLRGFLVLAAGAALYGLVRVAFSLDKILWLDVVGRSLLTSGFLNQNSAATFFGMSSLAALALVMEGARSVVREATSGRDIVRRGAARLAGGLGFDVVLFFASFVALLVTASRGGIFATLAGVLVLVLLYGLKAKSKQRGHGASWTLTIVLGVGLVVAVFELAGVRFASRLMQQGLESELRLGTYVQTLQAVNDHLWVGAGLGTFQDVFPAYRQEIGNWVWDKAHNDYLELVLGLGLPAALAVVVALAWIVLKTLKGFFERRRDAAFAAAAVTVSVLVGLHSAVDFSLQIQANTLAFALLLGVGLAQSISSRG
jgi:O-antigen ligase